jgi:ankyrin repeat protein
MRHSKQLSIFPVFLALASLLQSADPTLSDKFYNAIRTDNKPAVAQLLKDGADVNTRDTRGATPLMYAAAVGSPEMMRQLLAAGADVNAKNNFEATALLWCTNNLEKVRLLIDKGANVNAISKSGRTPVRVAAAHSGNVEVVRLLLNKGADLTKPKEAGAEALVAAASANDAATIKLLLDRGVDADSRDSGGFTALMVAAERRNVEVVKWMLARGANVNAQSNPSAERPVKNGLIAIGSLTPLLLAVAAGSTDVVRILLDAGANVNEKDVRGMTPLMLAVATDHPNEKVIQMLLAKKPVMDARSKANETALDWAAKFRRAPILEAVRKASPGVELAKPVPVSFSRSTRDIREAVEKSVELLQKTTVSFLKEGGCFGCHAQNITSVAVAAARAKGIRVDDAAASEVVRGTRLQFAAFADGMLERMDPPVVDIISYTMFGVSAEHTPPDRITDAIVNNIAAQQLADGLWAHAGILRPPTMDTGLSASAFCIRALREYGSPARKAEMDERIARAGKALISVEPATTEDSVMQLLGAKWAGMPAATIDSLVKRVLALQREDGGWAQTPFLKSDAYATGSAMYALKESNAATIDAAYRKGVTYLLSTQAEDGSWYVASRAAKFQPYFEGGFPYGHDQWISQWATGYSAIALSYAIPENRAAK